MLCSIALLALENGPLGLYNKRTDPLLSLDLLPP